MLISNDYIYMYVNGYESLAKKGMYGSSSDEMEEAELGKTIRFWSNATKRRYSYIIYVSIN